MRVQLITLYLTVALTVTNALITASSEIRGMLTGSPSQKKVNLGGTMLRDANAGEKAIECMTADNKTAQISTCVAFIL